MPRRDRPHVRVPRSATEWWLEGLSLGLATVAVLLTLLAWGDLPESVATHYGADGQPDAFGSKGNAAIPAVMAVGVYLLLSAIRVFVPPRLYNYPVPITRENAPAQYRLARTFLGWITLGVTAALAILTWLTLQTALGERAGLGWWFPLLLLGAPLAAIVVYVTAARRRVNPAETRAT